MRVEKSDHPEVLVGLLSCCDLVVWAVVWRIGGGFVGVEVVLFFV